MSDYRSHNADFAANQDNESQAQKHLDEFWQNLKVSVDRAGACQDFDAQYTYANSTFRIEEKIRFIGNVRDDILLEIVQALEVPDWGWLTKTPADRLVYVLCGADWIPIKLYSFLLPDLRRWYYQTYLPTHAHGQYICSAKGYGITINLVLPIRDIPKALYKVHLIGSAT